MSYDADDLQASDLPCDAKQRECQPQRGEWGHGQDQHLLTLNAQLTAHVRSLLQESAPGHGQITTIRQYDRGEAEDETELHASVT